MKYEYIHKEWFDGIDNPNFCKDDQIVLWGAGKVGSVVAHSLLKRGYDFIAFVDTAKDKQGTYFYDHKVISPDELREKYRDAHVIVSCAFPIVMEELKSMGFRNVWDPHSFLIDVDLDGYKGSMTYEYLCRTVGNALRNYAFYYKRGYTLERLLFIITDKCTLKCLNCDGYIPYHIHPENGTYEQIIQSFENLMKVCERVDAIDVLGGEPLVHPDIHRIVDHFLKDSRCNRVNIISNGTVYPKDELIKVIKNPKCCFRISDYGSLSKEKERVIALCKEENINLEITNYDYWDRVPQIQKLDDTEEELDSKYATCTANVLYVKNGYAYHCAFVAGLSELCGNKYLIPNMDENRTRVIASEGYDVYEDIKKTIEQLQKRKHIDACKYCPGSHCIQWEEKVPVAEQAPGKLPVNLLYKNGMSIE